MNLTNSPGICARCETLPEKIEDSGNLYLWFPSGHSLIKTIHYLRKAELEYQLKEDGQCVVVHLEETQIQEFVNTLAGILTKNELKSTQALFTTHPGDPQLRDFCKTTSLSRFICLSQSSWLLDMLAGELSPSNQFPRHCPTIPDFP